MREPPVASADGSKSHPISTQLVSEVRRCRSPPIAGDTLALSLEMADEPPKKKKKTAKEDDEGDSAGKTYEERLKAVGPISQPLADKKHTKKLHKLVKKASGAKALRRGVKEVVKGLRKGMKGVCIIAGDISPIDVISHLPVFCEESAVPYVYVPSKQDLGAAAMTKRPTSCVLIVPRDGFKADEELYAECSQYMKKVAIDV